MKLLLADDDPMFSRLAQSTLAAHFEVTVAENGTRAWECLLESPPPKIAVLNWVMPGLDGVELCRRIRGTEATSRVYVLFLTARTRIEDILAGFKAGADDYLVKPFHPAELRARVGVGARLVGLQDTLADRIAKLEDALRQVDTLRGLLPICSYCKRIRDDKDYWEQLESYLSKHSHVEFTHGICPSCYDKYLRPELAALRAGREK
jgi:DNA-binding response OmpR family regulator